MCSNGHVIDQQEGSAKGEVDTPHCAAFTHQRELDDHDDTSSLATLVYVGVYVLNAELNQRIVVDKFVGCQRVRPRLIDFGSKSKVGRQREINDTINTVSIRHPVSD